MGSAPSDEMIRDLEKEAYAALLRAIYANPHGSTDPLAIDDFLTKARMQLRIDNLNHSAILEGVRTDLEFIRQGHRIVPGKGTPVSTPVGAIGAPGGARSKSRASGGFKTPSTGGKSGGRGRSTRSSGGVDPQGMVGRRIWRYYPEEDAMNPWVEGFLTDYDPNSGTYTILYDPNRPELESTETGFDFNAISQHEYVLGDYVHLPDLVGSRRLPEKPQAVRVTTPGQGPSKRKRGGLKIPPTAPFTATWFDSAVHEASMEELDIMLSMLEQREIDVVASLEEAEKALALGEELEARLKLEREFEELCQKEKSVMDQLDELRKIEP